MIIKPKRAVAQIGLELRAVICDKSANVDKAEVPLP
jgi:hypothetical protein